MTACRRTFQADFREWATSLRAVSLFRGSIDGAQSVTATIRMGRFRGHRGHGPRMCVRESHPSTYALKSAQSTWRDFGMSTLGHVNFLLPFLRDFTHSACIASFLTLVSRLSLSRNRRARQQEGKAHADLTSPSNLRTMNPGHTLNEGHTAQQGHTLRGGIRSATPCEPFYLRGHPYTEERALQSVLVGRAD